MNDSNEHFIVFNEGLSFICKMDWKFLYSINYAISLYYGHLHPITKTIQVRRTRHAGHCWRSKDELTGDLLLWTLTYGRAKAGQPARTYIQQLCEDTGCSPEDLPEAMNNREKWRERVRDIRHDDDCIILKKSRYGVLFLLCYSHTHTHTHTHTQTSVNIKGNF